MTNFKALPHQFEVLADTTTRTIAMTGGYGCGKTYTACRKAIQLASLNIGFTGIMTEPTFPMLRDILVPEMKLALEDWNVSYKFNASSYTFTLYFNDIETKIICMSAENYDRLVGINAAWAIMDEFDTSKTEIALSAYQKILGRLRSGNVRQLVITTTPEGFRATYSIFVENKDDSKRLIRARTMDNKYLPEDFIDTLKSQYPEQLLKAYLYGEFVNLTQGSIYSYYERHKHRTDRTIEKDDFLIIGQDFNIGGCCSVVYVREGNKLYAVDEYVSNDTMELLHNTKKRYPNNDLMFFPDASGYAGKTNASKSDIQLIKDFGYAVNAPKANGRVMDRILSTNKKFEDNELFINDKKCPRYAKALEQQAWTDKGEPEKFSGAATTDDWNDAGTYPIVRLFGLTRPKATIKTNNWV